MKLDHAVKVVKALQRYHYRNCVKRHPRGAFLRHLIPYVTNTEFKQAIDAQEPAMGEWIWVNVDHLKSTQTCLAFRRLLKQLRMHPNKKRPIVVQIAPKKYVIWDGNHRAMSAILLGEHRVKCLLVGVFGLRKIVK